MLIHLYMTAFMLQQELSSCDRNCKACRDEYIYLGMNTDLMK
jgi:hypothetical protein